MSRPRYAVGDTVVIKSDAFRRTEHDRRCRIAVVLPEAQGIAQYRIKFEDENYERRITEAEIDREATSMPKRAESGVRTVSKSSWINSSAIKIKR